MFRFLFFPEPMFETTIGRERITVTCEIGNSLANFYDDNHTISPVSCCIDSLLSPFLFDPSKIKVI